MHPKVAILLLIISFLGKANAQNISTNRTTKSLRSQLIGCIQNNQKLSTENTDLQFHKHKLTNNLAVLQDSVFSQKSQIINLHNDIHTLIDRNIFLTKSITSNENFIADNKIKLQKANYEIEILINPLVIKIYNLSMDTLRQALTTRLSEMSLGYLFEEKENQFKITKTLEGNNDLGWPIDKSSIILLEIKIRLEPHQFEKNKTLVYAFTNFYKKPRYSNKQFAIQDDEEKAFFFQNKFIKLLEIDFKQSDVKKYKPFPK